MGTVRRGPSVSGDILGPGGGGSTQGSREEARFPFYSRGRSCRCCSGTEGGSLATAGPAGMGCGGFASPPPSRPSWGPQTLGEVGGCPNPSVAPILSTRAGCIPGQEPCNIPRLGALASHWAWVRVPCAPPRSPLRRERSAGSWRAPAAGGVLSPATLPPRGRLGEGKMAAAPRRGAPGPARAEHTY